MDIKQLESFVCIARTGSMTSAAEVLYLSTPALAQQSHRLERAVRVPLFTRSPRGMTLTPAGEVFLEDAQQILEMTQRMLNRCRETETKTERTVCIASIKGLVPDFYPVMQYAVRSHCPDIQLEHIEDTPEALCEALLDGRIDAMELYDAPMTRSPVLGSRPEKVRMSRSSMASVMSRVPGLMPAVRPKEDETMAPLALMNCSSRRSFSSNFWAYW